MAYIYKITNDINQKIYIGKTEFSIERRFKEHCRDSRKETEEHRPLYAAMRKYGVEHFHIELLEETDDPEEREKYWIETLGSFKWGYNATLGGDGRKYIDREQVIQLWNKGLNCKQIGNLIKHDPGTISNILKTNGISVTNKHKGQKTVCQLNKNKELIAIFNSQRDAARTMIINGYSHCKESTGATHIGEVCSNKRKSFAGFLWQWLDDIDDNNIFPSLA